MLQRENQQFGPTLLSDPKWHAKVKAEPWRQVLLDAADLIDRIGWCQHRLRDHNGRVCAAEALMKVAYAIHDPATYAVAMTRLSDFVASAEQFPLAVLDWNDAEERTAGEVTGTMRACADAPMSCTSSRNSGPLMPPDGDQMQRHAAALNRKIPGRQYRLAFGAGT